MLTVTQLVKKFPALYGTRRFITVVTTARHWFLSWARRIQSTYSRPFTLNSFLILPSHVRLGLPSDLSPLKFPNQNFECTSHLCHGYYCLFHPHWFDRSNNVWWSVQVMQSSPALPHILYLSTLFPDTLNICPSSVWETKFHTNAMQQVELWFV
jgi:hypothetical protein